MRRYNGLNFQNDLNTFTDGLDNHQSFWIGLDTLYKLTAGTYNTLRIEYVTITYKHEIIDYKGFQIIRKDDYWATYDKEIVVKGGFFLFLDLIWTEVRTSICFRKKLFWKRQLKSDSHLPKNFLACFNKRPLKRMKNNFYLILKALFVLKIFQFLSWVI